MMAQLIEMKKELQLQKTMIEAQRLKQEFNEKVLKEQEK